MNLFFRVPKDSDLVFDFLTDMDKFASVHPVISKIDRMRDGSYLVYETLKFAFIPLSFTYPVSVEKNIPCKTVVMRAEVFKVTKIEMKFELKADEATTIINEDIKFRAPLLLRGLMGRIFRKQHRLLFKNIEMQ